MADVMADYKVEQQRLIMQIATLKANMERFKLEIMEFESRKENTLGNIRATEEAITEHEARLASLTEAHGEPA